MNTVGKRLTVVKGEFGRRDLGKLVMIQPMNDPPEQLPALYEPPKRVMRVPNQIAIDPEFQRTITERGKRLIWEMVRQWDWSAFVAPAIYFDKKRQIEVAYDGQHTLIAAQTRTDITSLPCDLHESLEAAKDAAASFGVRNYRRIPPTTFQRFRTALVAQESWATRLIEIAKEVGFTIALHPGKETVDEVQSIATLRYLLEKHGTQVLTKIMKVLTGVAIAPIREAHLKALEMLMFDPSYAKLVNFNNLRSVLRGLNNNLMMREMQSEAIARGMVRHHVLANIYLREYQGVHGVK